MSKKKLAIVGVGPRGLYATENLLSKLSSKAGSIEIELLFFEETGHFGNGQVYDVDQVLTNWININERILYLNKRNKLYIGNTLVPEFPSYHDWAGLDYNSILDEEPDTYPPRAKIGAYLKERFQTLIEPLLDAGIAVLSEEIVIDISVLDNNKISLVTNLNSYNGIDQVLLAIGHQSTYVSEQIDSWNTFVENNKRLHLFKNPYPISDFLNSSGLNKNSKIGLRGCGLAMIDVVRGISSTFGDFEIISQKNKASIFSPNDKLAFNFVPFSLDGLPPVPKPLNAKIDHLYKPEDEQIGVFASVIGNKDNQQLATSSSFLIDAILPLVRAVYSKLPDTLMSSNLPEDKIENIARQWLNNQKYKHDLIISVDESQKIMMQKFIGMAVGEHAVSLDFCIAQVWRHCQPTIYTQLSHNACRPDVFADIIGLDEQLKRYTYGPPVESIQQLVALESAGFLTFDYANNPEIELSENGWILKSDKNSVKVDFMINSVLNAPEVKSVNSQIVKNLLSNDMMQIVHDDYGVLTDANGYLISKDKNTILPIALLGRLAKGTIIGVDAILECFGSRPKAWAEACVEQILK
jgi:uncharacterized NAD(P)/FAD-binding protein YdhS